MGTTVWVLVGFLTIRSVGGPVVIDNIASKEACESLKSGIEKQMMEFRNNHVFPPTVHQTYACQAVEKAAVIK